MTPVRRQVGTDHGRIVQFLDEAIRAGYPVVYLAPDAMEAMKAGMERVEPAALSALSSVTVFPSDILSSGTALAMPRESLWLADPDSKVTL